MLARPIIIQKLDAALFRYEEECKKKTPDEKAKQRKTRLGNLIQEYKSNGATDNLTALLTAYKEEKKALSFFGGSRLIDHLQDALFDIFQIPFLPVRGDHYGQAGGCYAIVDDIAKHYSRKQELDNAITVYIDGDRHQFQALLGIRVSL